MDETFVERASRGWRGDKVPEHVYIVFADYGPQGGGWGPAAVGLPGKLDPMPLVYSGTKAHAIKALHTWAKTLSDSGLETKVCKFHDPEVLAHFIPRQRSSE